MDRVADGDLRAEEFARALGESHEEPLSAAAQLHQACVHVAGKPVLALLALATATAALLLALRPPFAVSIEHDQKRPWKSSQRVSWVSVVVVTLLAVLVPLAVHLLV